MSKADIEDQSGLHGADAEQDTLSQIEQRVLRTVELVNSLRQERDSLLRELAEARSAGEQTDTANRALSEEIVSLKSERQLVRGRLERLLGHIDQLS
jgi:uncharacterized coiled-coil DUF342 family protein